MQFIVVILIIIDTCLAELFIMIRDIILRATLVVPMKNSKLVVVPVVTDVFNM